MRCSTWNFSLGLSSFRVVKENPGIPGFSFTTRLKGRFVVPGKRVEVLTLWMELIEGYTLNRALRDLTQEEFEWEPHAGAYGVRRRKDCKTPNPSGSPDGEWVSDGDWATAEASDRGELVEPMTTIAWLLNHIGAAPGTIAQSEVVGGSMPIAEGTYVGMWGIDNIPTVEPAVTRFTEGWSSLKEKLRNTTDEVLERQHPHHPWGRGDVAIAAMLNEISHHGTQICMLRDLYAHRDERNYLAQRGFDAAGWDSHRELIERGERPLGGETDEFGVDDVACPRCDRVEGGARTRAFEVVEVHRDLRDVARVELEGERADARMHAEVGRDLLRGLDRLVDVHVEGDERFAEAVAEDPCDRTRGGLCVFHFATKLGKRLVCTYPVAKHRDTWAHADLP